MIKMIKKIIGALSWRVILLKNRSALIFFMQKYKKNLTKKCISNKRLNLIEKDPEKYKELFLKDLKNASISASKITISVETLLSDSNILFKGNKEFYDLSYNRKQKILLFYKKINEEIIKIRKISNNYHFNIFDYNAEKRKLMYEGYILGVVCKLIEYNIILMLTQNITSKELKKFLNEKRDDLIENSFDSLIHNVLNRWIFARLYYFNNEEKLKVEVFFKGNKDIIMDKEGWLLSYLKFYENDFDLYIKELTESSSLWKIIFNLNINEINKAIYPLQTKFFTWIGDTKVKRKKSQLISFEQVKKIEELMMPGDIILERRNWYLSNIFLNGFWPHAALFIGDLDKLNQYFDKNDPEIRFIFEKEKVSSIEELFLKKHPETFKNYLIQDKDKNHNRIIEATSEGIIFNSVEHSLHADFVAVIRPNLSRKDILLALLDSFKYYGREYDFNFDFVSENTLVCTELVVKSYGFGKNKKGIDFVGSNEYGKKVVKANDMCKQFDKEYNSQKSQFSFVAFLDGNEKNKNAIFSTVNEFRKSYSRKGFLSY